MGKNAVATVEKPAATLSVPSKDNYTPEQLALIKSTIAVNHTNDELSLFIGQCERTGLDPFARQIYSIKRGNKAVTQVSIDGFRLIANRTGEMDGYDDTVWFDKDGKEHTVWLANTAPVAAKVTVYRKGCSHGFSATARFMSYCAYNDRDQPMGLWAKMPDVMIAKCAEALALRKAFPQELSGLYTADEMDQAGGSGGSGDTADDQAGGSGIVEAEVIKQSATTTKTATTTKADSSSSQTDLASGESEEAFGEIVDAVPEDLADLFRLIDSCEKLEPAKPNSELKGKFLQFVGGCGFNKEEMNNVLLDAEIGILLDSKAISTKAAYGKMRQAAQYFSDNRK